MQWLIFYNVAILRIWAHCAAFISRAPDKSWGSWLQDVFPFVNKFDLDRAYGAHLIEETQTKLPNLSLKDETTPRLSARKLSNK